MPAFNTEGYIGRALESALAQTRHDCEVIVVDDGSTDETARVVERMGRRDARVRLIVQANSGPAKARNVALAEARGQFFALLDSDDEWMPEYLAAQLDLLERHPDVSVVTANVINRGGPADGRAYWPASDTMRRLTLLDMIEREDSVCIMSLFRRDVYTAIGGFDETFINGSEDYDYWLRAAAAGFGFAQQRRALGFYQRRPESMSARQLNMLLGITQALGKTRASAACPDTARAAIDRQLARFEQERLAFEGASALRNHDFGTAAARFGSLYASRGGARLALVAAWSRYAPSSLLLLDTLRRSVRFPVRALR